MLGVSSMKEIARSPRPEPFVQSILFFSSLPPLSFPVAVFDCLLDDLEVAFFVEECREEEAEGVFFPIVGAYTIPSAGSEAGGRGVRVDFRVGTVSPIN